MFEMLKHVTADPDLTAPDYDSSPSGSLIQFDQDEFFGGNAGSASLDGFGYAYVPAACDPVTGSDVTCRLHVFFHGCSMQAELVRSDGTAVPVLCRIFVQYAFLG